MLKAARTSLRVPVMKNFRDNGHRAYIDVDELYVDDKRYIPNSDERTRLRDQPQTGRGKQNYNVEQGRSVSAWPGGIVNILLTDKLYHIN